MGQYPKLHTNDYGKIVGNGDIQVNKTITIKPDTSAFQISDTTPVIMQVSDTSIISGKVSNKIVWIKGYRVNNWNETYYLDVVKQRLPKRIIIWLDQNL